MGVGGTFLPPVAICKKKKNVLAKNNDSIFIFKSHELVLVSLLWLKSKAFADRVLDSNFISLPVTLSYLSQVI